MKKKYLTINQLANACSTSRSTLLRMEKDGILEPAYINPENGYRFYDGASVLRVVRNLTFQELGFTHKELRNYYQDAQCYENLLESLQQKMKIMEYNMESIRLQLREEKHLSISRFFFPEVYCYTYELKNHIMTDSMRSYIWKALNDALYEGYSVNRRIQPFVMINLREMKNNDYNNIGYDYTICIPVIPNSKSQGLLHLTETQTLSTIVYGGTSDMMDAFAKIQQEEADNNLDVSPMARIIAAVNSYPGEEIPREYWALRVCVPIIK